MAENAVIDLVKKFRGVVKFTWSSPRSETRDTELYRKRNKGIRAVDNLVFSNISPSRMSLKPRLWGSKSMTGAQ